MGRLLLLLSRRNRDRVLREMVVRQLEAVLSESAAVDEQVQAVKNDLTIYMSEVQRITRELDEILAPVDEAKMKVERNKGRIAACERDIRTLRGSIAAVTEQMQKKENDTRKKQQVEALQQALAALVGVSGGSRIVGIISHVAELKDRIDRQIIVTKDRSGGSRVQVQA